MTLSHYQLSHYVALRRVSKYNARGALVVAQCLPETSCGYVAHSFANPVTRMGAAPAPASRLWGLSEFGARHASDCDRGWYCNDFGETFTGGAAHLTHGRFVACVTDPWGNEPFVADLEIYHDEDEARRAGDAIAERMAEREREYQADWNAGAQARQEFAEALGCIKAAKDAIRVALEDCSAPAAAYAMKEAGRLIKDARIRRRAALDTIATLFDAGRDAYAEGVDA